MAGVLQVRGEAAAAGGACGSAAAAQPAAGAAEATRDPHSCSWPLMILCDSAECATLLTVRAPPVLSDPFLSDSPDSVPCGLVGWSVALTCRGGVPVERNVV